MIDILIENHEAIKNILTSLAILLGGAWTIWRFVLQREGNAKIQFEVDFRIIGKLRETYVVEVMAIVENKGNVRHYINDFSFDLLYLTSEDKLQDGDDRINRQLLFNKAIDKRFWIPPSWYHSFIDQGVVQNYTYVTHLPGNAKFVSVYAQFKYPRFSRFLPFGKSFHTSQKTFSVKDILDPTPR